MNRTGVAALIAAGIVGIVGGTVSAVVRGDNAPASTPGTGAKDGPSASTSKVLYAGNKTIHDGAATVRFTAPFETPDRLLRSSTGYLIAHRTNDQEPGSRIYSVAKDGTTAVVADVQGTWDLDATRTRVVGTDPGSGRVRVWSLDGKVVATAKQQTPAAVAAVWSGDKVLVTQRSGGQHPEWRLSTWTPQTDTWRRTNNLGMLDLVASADGKLLSGSVNLDGISGDQANPCLRVGSAPGAPNVEWRTCDWRLNGSQTGVFSPKGSRILAVPSEGDGIGPALFATFSAARGPSADLKSFPAPQWTLGAVWLDENTLLVTSKTDPDLDENTGTIISQCGLDGACKVVARRDKGDLVAGEQG